MKNEDEPLESVHPMRQSHAMPLTTKTKAEIGDTEDFGLDFRWEKQCHTPPIWERFITPNSGEVGDTLFLF